MPPSYCLLLLTSLINSLVSTISSTNSSSSTSFTFLVISSLPTGSTPIGLYNNLVKEYEEGKAEGEQELADAFQELKDGEQEIKDNRKKLQNAERTLYDAKLELLGKQAELQQGKQQFEAEKPAEPVKVEQPEGRAVTCPLVGVFYAAPSPNDAPFVSVGSTVKKGDVLCIVEAMKLMNEITAEQDGTITEICVENGQVVEFGQPLFYLA